MAKLVKFFCGAIFVCFFLFNVAAGTEKQLLTGGATLFATQLCQDLKSTYSIQCTHFNIEVGNIMDRKLNEAFYNTLMAEFLDGKQEVRIDYSLPSGEEANVIIWAQ